MLPPIWLEYVPYLIVAINPVSSPPEQLPGFLLMLYPKRAGTGFVLVTVATAELGMVLDKGATQQTLATNRLAE